MPDGRTNSNGSLSFLQDGTAKGELPETVSCFDGVFYNYFSIGNFLFQPIHYSPCLLAPP